MLRHADADGRPRSPAEAAAPREPARAVLVVSPSAHPWALLRDRLDPGLALVEWARPEELAAAAARLDPGPWVVAGDVADLPVEAIRRLRGAAFAADWVGPPPAGFPVRPRPAPAWGAIADRLEDLLRRPVGSLTWAPGRGLAGAIGGVAGRTASLEGVLAGGPAGIDVPDGRLRGRWAGRARAVVERHRLPLGVAVSGTRITALPG